jgi:signal transduction histidine kinase
LLRGLAISKNTLVILVAIGATATILSMLAFQYSNSISTKVVDIAIQEIRSNAIIQAHDLSEILTNRLESIIPLLQTLSDSPAIQNNEYQRARLIIDSRQNYTNSVTDFYMWLDGDGKIVWISNINSTAYQQYKDFDLSYRPYFTMARDSGMEYYSSVIESNDKVPRYYLSYPIMSKQGTEYSGSNVTEKGSFMGVVVAGIRTSVLGDLLKSQLLPQFNSTIGLLDKNGLILYANTQSYIGKNIFGRELQSALSTLLSQRSLNQLNEALNASVHSADGSGSIDVISKEGTVNTLAFSPVLLNGTNFLTLYVAAPHNLAGDVASAINEQNYFSILIITIIGSIATIIAYIVLTWNKRLHVIVNSRTKELDEANKELTAAYEQLKIHNKTQKEFIDIAAHELRTPLQPIIGIMNVIRSKVTDSEQQKLLEIVIRNAKRLQRLVEDVLDVTRIEGHTLDIKKEVLNINDTIASILQEYRSQMERNNKEKYSQFPEISFQLEKAGVYVQADKGRITQVISNLIDNAIKFAPHQNGKLDIVVARSDSDNRELEPNGNVIVSVKDNGTGIDPEVMPRLFSKFVTKSFSGIGLGLYVSKNIIEAHGGKIWAENNNDGNGATFYFSLPILGMTGLINISPQ